MKLKDFFFPSPKPTTSNFLSPQPSPNFHPFIPFSLIHVSFFLFSHSPVSFSLSLAPSHLPPTSCFSGFTFSFPIKAYISLLFSPLPLFYLSLSLSCDSSSTANHTLSFPALPLLNYRPFNCHPLQPIRVIYIFGFLIFVSAP